MGWVPPGPLGAHASLTHPRRAQDGKTALVYARENGHADVIKALEGSRVGRTTGADAQAAALNDVAQGIDRFGYRAYATSLVAILLNANPPACVGLYAKWGSGKSFFIQLLKEEFDRQARALVNESGKLKLPDGFLNALLGLNLRSCTP